MTAIRLLVILLVISCSACNTIKKERFEIKKGQFLLDEEPIQLICGEMHYPRIPREYWRDRLKRAKAMGLNTVSAYVFWNFHERQQGQFDFEGQADLEQFIRLAQEEELYVILRPGPYVCAEWDLGEIMTIKGIRLQHPYYLPGGIVKDFRIHGHPQFFLFN